MVPPPLGLYVHLPWCVRKCPYCDFNSHETRGAVPVEAYTDALLLDLDRELARAPGRPVESVFIGGGTPSLFPPEAVARILDRLGSRLGDAPEITLEANPGTVDEARFSGFRLAGINRLSIGVQSFQPQLLQRIGRIHDGAEARRAAEAAHAAGFERINLDLMFGLPGQTVAQAVADARIAMELQVAHVSHYQLTLEPNTVFYSRPPTLPDDDLAWEMQNSCGTLLHGYGLHRYEISAWARPGEACRHNLNYWGYGDYLGIGAGAHGKLTHPNGQVIRYRKVRVPAAYMRPGTATRDAACWEVPEAERPLEFLMNALRLQQGFTMSLFESRTGLDGACMRDSLATLEAEGLLRCEGETIRTSRLGMNHLDSVLQRFLPEAVS